MNSSQGKEPVENWNGCHYQKMLWGPLMLWNGACMCAPVLAFANYTKEFLLETDASKEGLGALLSQKQADGWYYPVTYGSWALMAQEKNYHSTKLQFLVLKWAVTEHFTECLPYQPFLVRTDNNPLTYIMTTPSLNATGHWWVRALARFNFQLEYQKGWDNVVEDMLSQITTLSVWRLFDPS